MSERPLEVVVFGSGGFGREVAWALRHPDATVITEDGQERPIRVIGFLDDDTSVHGQELNGLPVLGGSDWISDNKGIGVMIGVGIPTIKAKVVERLTRLGATFPTFIDPRAVVGDEVLLGKGVILCAGVIATCNIQIGDFAMVNLSVTIGHDVRLGKFVTVSPAANLSGYVEVGDLTDLGTDCTVIPGKKIGHSCVIGAMACVTKDIPDNATAVGIPAKVIKIADPAQG